MINSFQLTPAAAQGGAPLTLLINSLSDPPGDSRQKYKIEFFEVDAGGTDDLIATFAAEIHTASARGAPPFYQFKNVSRTDTFDASLPVSPARKSADGSTSLPYKPQWKVPHFMLQFSAASTGGPPPAPFTVLIKSEAGEIEKYIYQIGFKITVDGKEIFSSITAPVIVDCARLLALNCAEAATAYMQDHQDLVDARGMGSQYGSQYEPSLSGTDLTTFRTNVTQYKLSKTDCISYVLASLKSGHEKSDAMDDWKQIQSSIKRGTGISLAEGLQAHEWLGIYYNCDTKNHSYNNEHSYSYAVAKNNKTYYKLRVHDLVTDYGASVPADQAKVLSQLNRLKNVPFGVINARGGYHTALLLAGNVYEVHWSAGPDDPDLYETTPFEDWTADEQWLSGIVHTPRGCW